MDHLIRDWKLTVLHASADLATFFGCVLITITTAYIYRRGKFKDMKITYSELWSAGASFVFFLGIVRILSFLEIAFEGPTLQWYLGISKIFTAICCLWFVRGLWNAKNDIVQIGQILNMLSRDQEER